LNKALKGLNSVIIGVILLTLVAVGCAPAQQAPAPAPIVFKYEDFAPNGSARTAVLEWWGSEVAKRTNGQVKIEFYWSESLVKSKDIPDALKSGLADMGTWLCSYAPDKMPLAGLSGLPVANKSLMSVTRSFQELCWTNPDVVAELDKWNVKLMFSQPSTMWRIYTVKNVPVTSVAQLKGMKLRGLGYAGIMTTCIGAATVTIPMPDMYEALQRGTVEGEVTATQAWKNYGHTEVAPNVLWETPSYATGSFIQFVNKDSWNKLTPAQQKIMTDLNEEATVRSIKDLGEEEDLIMKALGNKVNITHITPDELAAWAKLSGPAIESNWTGALDPKGIPASKTLAAYKVIINKWDSK
jgi:TRAP-type C4-dicarboxylate transport system substrate-binding protein